MADDASTHNTGNHSSLLVLLIVLCLLQDGNGPASPSAKNLRSYNLDQNSDASLASEQNVGRNKLQRKNSKSDMAAAKEDHDKLLKIGIYSNANRLVFAVAVVLLWGPQNWLFRVIAERKGIHPPKMDKIIRKRKKKTGDAEPELKEESFFCNDTDDNRPVDYVALDQSNVRHMAIPYSPFMYNHQLYDWPPEPEYARVTK